MSSNEEGFRFGLDEKRLIEDEEQEIEEWANQIKALLLAIARAFVGLWLSRKLRGDFYASSK